MMKYMHPILLYRELVWNVRPGEPLRLLGLQIGATHVGVAISDVPKGPVSYHCSLEREKGSIMTTKFRKLIKEQSVGGIVVGVPSSIQGKNPGKNLYGVFIDELNKSKKLKDVQYTIWNDKWSEPKTVSCLLDPFPLNPEVKKVLRDKEIHRCATSILQSYIDDVKLYVFADL